MGPVWHCSNPGARPHRSPFSLSSIFWEVLHREVVMFSSDCRWSVGKRILHQVSMWWVSYPMIEIRNCSGTCWKIEGLKQVGVGFFFGIQVSFVTSRCDGWEEESFPVWGTNTGQTDRLINSFDQENWRRLWRQQNNYWLSSSPVRLRFMAVHAVLSIKWRRDYAASTSRGVWTTVSLTVWCQHPSYEVIRSKELGFKC